MANILVVEDSKFQRKKIVSILESQGHVVTQAGNGEEAINLISDAKEGDIDLLVTDILMPKLDGIGLLRRIEELGISVKTIVLSADIQDLVKHECYELGAMAFLEKPVEERSLTEMLDNVLAAA